MKLARTKKERKWRGKNSFARFPKRTMDKGNGGRREGGEREDSGFCDSLFERGASVGGRGTSCK